MNSKNKKIICKGAVAVLLLMVVSCLGACPAHGASPDGDMLAKQQELTGFSRLYASLPQETRLRLGEMGISDRYVTDAASLSPAQITGVIGDAFVQNSRTPLSAATACFCMVLLLALTQSAGLLGEKTSLSRTTAGVGALCVGSAVLLPLCGVIEQAAEVLQGASGFMLLYVPFLAGLSASTGAEQTALSYYSFVMAAGETISFLSAHGFLPLMKVFFGLSVTSAISPQLRLNGLCRQVYDCAKQLLTLGMSIFVTVLTAQTLISSSMDRVSRRTLRFVMSSFVPAVGSLLGDTLTSFSGSLEVLKTGAGVFVMVAAGCLFLPVLAQCTVWRLLLNLLAGVSDMMGQSECKPVFDSASTVLAFLTALLLSVLVILLISTLILLLVGSGGTV